MAIPSVITDLSTNTASNSPLGSDLVGSPATVDDFFRSAFKITRDESLLKSWEIRGNAVTYVSGTTFTMTGDQTGFFSATRRIKAAGGSTIYGAIVSSSYNGAITTATILGDSGATMDASLSNVQLGIDPLSAAVILTGSYYPLVGGELNGNMTISNRDIAKFKNMYAFAEYDNGNSGAADTIDFANGQNQKSTLTADTTLTIASAPGVGHYQLRLIQDATGGRTVVFVGVSAARWLNSAVQPAFNNAANGETILTFFWNGTAYTVGMQKVGAT
jgi:hypothetical protein